MRGGLAGSLVLVLVATVALALPARAQADDPSKAPKKTKLAVFDVHAQGVDASTAATLTDVLAVELGKVPSLEVVTNAQVQSLLGLQQKKSMLGCDDVSCMAEIAGSLGVDKLCIGSLGKIDQYDVLTLRVIDVATAQVDKSVYKKEHRASAFIDEMPDLVAKLFPQPSLGSRALVDLKRLVTPAPRPKASAPPVAVVTPPVAAASPQPSGFMTYVRKPWVWAVAGGTLMLLGGAEYNAEKRISAGSTALEGLGLLAGTVSFGLCVCPWNWGSGADEPAVPVLRSPAAASAQPGAVREE